MANAVVETHETEVEVDQHLSAPQRFMQFLRDTRSEMEKVATPTREEVKNGTIVTIATVFVFAAYFELVDLGIGKLIDKLFIHATR
ncbi:preprotein translocase subunit SecE [Granulicella cerasi]|uniref:Protein translocase subunit SecE n=1 Tax=Granulicella cerasi TaxID=741063 RepID=A0ABW1Z7G4_9BACT|nr:preprotein translocase subunit SecE [Granulicella cerasi]